MIFIIQIVIGVIIAEALWSCFEMFKEHVIEPRIKESKVKRLVKKEADKLGSLKVKVDGKKAKIELEKK